MSEHFHAITWIDHREAKIFHFNAEEVEREVVRAHGAGRHVQHKANVTGAGHKGIDKAFFDEVAAALDHPTEPQLVALARRFFKADDRMHAQQR